MKTEMEMSLLLTLNVHHRQCILAAIVQQTKQNRHLKGLYASSGEVCLTRSLLS